MCPKNLLLILEIQKEKRFTVYSETINCKYGLYWENKKGFATNCN